MPLFYILFDRAKMGGKMSQNGQTDSEAVHWYSERGSLFVAKKQFELKLVLTNFHFGKTPHPPQAVPLPLKGKAIEISIAFLWSGLFLPHFLEGENFDAHNISKFNNLVIQIFAIA